MNEEQLYEQIDAYLSGELQGRALDKFKADLKEDASLRKALKLQTELIAAIRNEREDELKSYIKANTARTPFSIMPRLKTILATAAVVSLLAVCTILLLPYLSSPSSETNTADVETEDKSTNDTSLDSEPLPIDTQTLAIAENNIPPEIEQEDILLPEENLVEEDEEAEDFDADLVEISEEVSPPPTKDSLIAQPATTQATANAKKKNLDDALEVKTDEILSTKSYPVYAVALDLENDTRGAVLLDNVAVAEKTRRRDRQQEKEDAAEAEEEVNLTKDKATVVRAIKVEYWKSVVNYRGYQYDGTKLKLYGMNEGTPLQFKELDNRLYVKISGKNYFLEQNLKYNRLVEVTNPTLLKVLNE